MLKVSFLKRNYDVIDESKVEIGFWFFSTHHLKSILSRKQINISDFWTFGSNVTHASADKLKNEICAISLLGNWYQTVLFGQIWVG